MSNPLRFVALLTPFALLLAGPAFAQGDDEEKTGPESGRVIVAAANASVQLQDAEPKAVAPGTIFTYSITNGPWIWSDRHWGWVKRADTVELSEAIATFTKIYQEAKDADGDEAQREAAVALHHRGISKLALGSAEAAIEDFEAAEKLGLDTAQLQMNFANAYRTLGKFDEAVEAATEAIRRAPDSSQAHDIRAGVLFEQDQFEASLVDSDQAVALDEANAEAFNNRGVTRRVMGQYRQAAEDYTRALKIAPRHPQALANRGYALKKLGRYKDAIRDYERAIKVNPDEPVVYNDLAWLLATCPEEAIRDPERAIELGETAVEMAPEDGRFLDTLAAAYAAAGQFEKATETGLEAVKKLDEAEQFEADQRVAMYIDGKPYVEGK